MSVFTTVRLQIFFYGQISSVLTCKTDFSSISELLEVVAPQNWWPVSFVSSWGHTKTTFRWCGARRPKVNHLNHDLLIPPSGTGVPRTRLSQLISYEKSTSSSVSSRQQRQLAMGGSGRGSFSSPRLQPNQAQSLRWKCAHSSSHQNIITIIPPPVSLGSRPISESWKAINFVDVKKFWGSSSSSDTKDWERRGSVGPRAHNSTEHKHRYSSMAPRRLRFDFDLRERRRRRLPKATKVGVGARPPSPRWRYWRLFLGTDLAERWYSSVGVHSLKIEYYGNQFPLNGPTERRQLRRSCTVRSTASGHSYRKNRKYRKPYCLFIGKEYRLCKQRRNSFLKKWGGAATAAAPSTL